MSQPIKIFRQNRRSMMMRVVPGAIEVFIPTRYQEGDKCVTQFIKKGLSKLGDQTIPEPEHKLTQPDILAMVQQYATRMNVQPSRVSLRDMRRKWGSCSALGSVTLNTRLCWLERPLAEYIVCHELGHLRELNHSKAFWAIVGEYMPDYKTRIHALKAVEKTFWGQA
jgi:hypothetical protein